MEFCILSNTGGCQYSSRVTQFGISWEFDKQYEVGQFCTGDYWVIGPVKIVQISNDWHVHGIQPGLGQDGSMLNPGVSNQQGYDDRLSTYSKELNVTAYKPNVEKPLVLNPGDSLVSTVSWLYESDSRKEPGCPKINQGTKMPRPILRDAAVLTCLGSRPPEGSFRPAYCGAMKSVRFNEKDLDYSKLQNLSKVPKAPSPSILAKSFARPWIDHVHQYLGAMVHPSENMPQYGQQFSEIIGTASLVLQLNYPDKQKRDLLIGLVQLGIDLAGIADAGGSWPSNGGHHMGRKWPILFAGVMLNDKQMKNVGMWATAFQEDDDTFYVSEREIEISRSKSWAPDKRADRVPYEEKHLGLPEWGILPKSRPEAVNLSWNATYRTINNSAFAGWVLAAILMNQREAWNHEPLFDYVDRVYSIQKHAARTNKPGAGFGGEFVWNMWDSYRENFGPLWTPHDRTDLYSSGRREGGLRN